MGSEEFVIDAGVIIEAVQLGGGGNFQEVLIAGLIFGQKEQVGRSFIQLRVFLPHGAGGHVGFDADDRLDVELLCGAEEIDNAEQCAVIGDGEGGHLQFVGALKQLGDIAKPIEQGVFGVDMQVDKIGHIVFLILDF